MHALWVGLALDCRSWVCRGGWFCLFWGVRKCVGVGGLWSGERQGDGSWRLVMFLEVSGVWSLGDAELSTECIQV